MTTTAFSSSSSLSLSLSKLSYIIVVMLRMHKTVMYERRRMRPEEIAMMRTCKYEEARNRQNTEDCGMSDAKEEDDKNTNIENIDIVHSWSPAFFFLIYLLALLSI